MAKDVFRVADGDFSPSDLTALARIDFGTYVELMFPISRRGRRSRTPADAPRPPRPVPPAFFDVVGANRRTTKTIRRRSPPRQATASASA